MSMTTRLCNLQARPVMQRQRSLFHVQEGNSEVTLSWNSATRQYRQVDATQGKMRNNLHFGTSYHSKKAGLSAVQVTQEQTCFRWNISRKQQREIQFFHKGGRQEDGEDVWDWPGVEWVEFFVHSSFLFLTWWSHPEGREWDRKTPRAFAKPVYRRPLPSAKIRDLRGRMYTGLAKAREVSFDLISPFFRVPSPLAFSSAFARHPIPPRLLPYFFFFH